MDDVEVIDVPPDEEDGISEDKKKSGWILLVAVGVIALVLGLFAGYFLRPVVGPEAQAAKATAMIQAKAVETQAAANQALMKQVVLQVRHWKGDENAPVTIIEWSDFQ